MHNAIFTVLIFSIPAAGLQAETVAFPETGWNLHEGGLRQQAMCINDYSPDLSKVIHLTFVPAVRGYAELPMAKPQLLARTAGQFKGVLVVEVCSETAAALRRMSVRIVDDKGEIFQLMQPLQLRPGIWTVLKFELSTSTVFNPVWGGNNDKKIDFPVSLCGLTFDFDKGWKGTGKIMIGKLEWIPN